MACCVDSTVIYAYIVMCRLVYILCAVFSQCCVQALVGVMCGVELVLGAACCHELRRVAPSMPRFAFSVCCAVFSLCCVLSLVCLMCSI